MSVITSQATDRGFSTIGILGGSIRIGYPHPASLKAEMPVQLREGVYDVERIGAFSYLGGGQSWFCRVKSIGRFCLISGNVVMGRAEHAHRLLSPHPLFAGSWDKEWPQLQEFYHHNPSLIRQVQSYLADEARTRFGKIEIGNDVWIGEGALIRRGVTISNGAVIAARALVTRDVEPYTIVAGIPARVIGQRFPQGIVRRLEAAKWWDYGLSALYGVDFMDIERALQKIERNIEDGTAIRYEPGWETIRQSDPASVSES